MPAAKPLKERDATDRDFDENGLSVWALLLGAEAWADVQTSHSKYKDALVGIRILGHFLCDFWKNRHNLSIGGLGPYRQLIWQINSCDAQPMVTASPQENGAGYQRLSDLGLWYRNHLMRVFRSNTGPVPVTSDHPSRPSLDAVREGIVADIKKADKTKKNVKQSALARDGFRCVVTGAYDDKTVTQCPKDFPASAPTSRTQCAHIFSESAQDGDKEAYVATALAILKMFNFDIESLLGGQVNTLRNVLTMTTNMHGSFDELEFWLEEVIGQPNTYDICSWRSNFSYMIDRPRERITLTIDPIFAAKCAADGVAPPELPSAALLAIRAAVSRVAHMSGAAEQYDMVMRDRESTTVMSGDAASAEMLSVLLQVNA
ncbi:hypothetical protein FB451DRAFT_1573850 [Mycena latifolia]|nr:hypothetical protein FB451DRAFT_1573850 [Mycena latifolia]